MSRIEAETTVAAAPAAVWQALLDASLWAAWAAPANDAAPLGRLTLESLAPITGPADGVGALRRGAATVRVPLLGTRAVRWVEQVTDVAAPWTLELETLGTPPASWRLRLWLVEQLDGDTRVRCRLTYRLAGLRRRLANALFLRRAVERHTQTMLAGLAHSFAPVVAEEAAVPIAESAEQVDEPVEGAIAVAA